MVGDGHGARLTAGVWDSFLVIFKVLVCSALLFVALAAAGIWLQRWRGR